MTASEIVATIIAAMSVAFVFYNTRINAKTHNAKEADKAKKDSADWSAIIVKLEIMNVTLTELKTEMRSELKSLKDDQRADHDKLTEVVASAKSAHRRLDEFGASRIKTD